MLNLKEASSLVADFFRRCKGYVTQQLIRVRDTTDWKQLPKTLQDELEESSGMLTQMAQSICVNL